MLVYKNKLVKPYFWYRFGYQNTSEYCAPLVIFPTIAVNPWSKQNLNGRRYGEGRYEKTFQIMFWFLRFEFYFVLGQKNYKYLSKEK